MTQHITCPDLTRPYLRFARLVDDMGPEAVYDGDGTVHLYIDQGFYIERFRIKGRLARIDAPEIRGGVPRTRAAARKSRDYLYQELRSQMDNHGGFWIESLGKDKYGRWLLELWRNDGININDAMVAIGHAVYRDY